MAQYIKVSLHALMRHLESHAVRIVAISIANSVDCAIVRLLVNDTDRGREILELSRFQFAEIELVGVELPEGDQPFLEVFLALLRAEVNVQYTYPLLYRRGNGAIALYVDDADQARLSVDALAPELIAELRLKVLGVASAHAFDVGSVEVHQAARKHRALAVPDIDGIARGEITIDADDAGRQQ